MPRLCSLWSTRFETVLLPHALRPVNQITQPLWFVQLLALFPRHAVFVPVDLVSLAMVPLTLLIH